MAKLSNEELLDQFSTMTLVELNDFVKAFEEKFDVKAAAPAAVAVAAPGAGAAPAEEEEEKTEFDVVLTGIGAQKIAVIKAVKALTGAALGDAKKLVDAAANGPSVILEKAKKEDADKAKADIEAAGGTVELK